MNSETQKKRILLVDDDQQLLVLNRLILEEEYEVVTAQDGKEALEEAEEHRPDLILMDVVMPRMNGLEACRRLREKRATETVPILMVTSQQDEVVREAAFESGCNDYLGKHTAWPDLLETIRFHLEATARC